MLYEVAYVKNGKLTRGGIKAPLPMVAEWIRELKEVDRETEYVAVPANEKAIPEERVRAFL